MDNKLYYSISEVSSITGIKPYILRYWEREFPELKPKKFSSGKRRYKKKDIETILSIKKLLYEENYRIEGAKLKLRTDKEIVPRKKEDELEEKAEGNFIHELEMESVYDVIEELKKEVEDLIEFISGDR